MQIYGVLFIGGLIIFLIVLFAIIARSQAADRKSRIIEFLEKKGATDIQLFWIPSFERGMSLYEVNFTNRAKHRKRTRCKISDADPDELYWLNPPQV